MATPLPPFAPFPTAAWKELLSIDDWNAALGGWISLAEAHMSLPDPSFTEQTIGDESVLAFLSSFMREIASRGNGQLGTSAPARLLLKDCFVLTSRVLRHPSPPPPMLQWEFLADFSNVYSKKRVAEVLAKFAPSSQHALESSLATLKKFLIKTLDEGIKGDLKTVEERLSRVNHLISASPSTASYFLAGSEFLDGLISCYTVMNPPLRKVIITTTYLSLMGLVENNPPKLSMLTDQLYSLKTAAETHKTGPLNERESLVPELVSSTPLIRQIEHKLEAAGTDNARVKNVLRDLGTWKKAGAMVQPKRLIKRKIDKGKGIAAMEDQEVHVHRMSQITQIQDIFPDLGSGFVSKLLDEYEGNTEEVTAHLLEESLPAHLITADRSEQLSAKPRPRRKSSLMPRPTPPQLPTRHNIYDDDDLTHLALSTSHLHIGKRDADLTADDLLADRSTAPNKAAILSALAAFDSDDDERDDTYDAADVGGAIDTAAAGNEGDPTDANEEALWRAYAADPRQFERDQVARKGASRARLRMETGMTDEAVEGWAVMLNRNAQQKRRLEMKYSAVNSFTGQQNELVSTSWQAGAEGSDTDGGSGSGRGGFQARGRGRGRGGGPGRGGSAAGPSGVPETEAARRRKEANKGSRANHNRRDGRAKKMARGGAFPG